jgi:deoxyribonuclease V
MNYQHFHEWDVSPAEAVTIQRRLRERVRLEPLRDPVHRVAGADIAVFRESQQAYAGVVVMSYPDLTLIEEQGERVEVTFPYIPGLLSFREIPVLLRVFERLRHEPDLILMDGQGIAHPRRMGIAAHLGLVLDKPTIGCAKSRLYGDYEEPDSAAGSIRPLVTREGEVIGAVVRTRTHVRPLFISSGHKIDLQGAVDYTLSTCRGYRLPEPTRQAHLFVNRLRYCE